MPYGANLSVNHPIEMGVFQMKRLAVLTFVLGASIAPAHAQSQKPVRFHGLVFDTPQQVYAARAQANAARAQASAPPARAYAAVPKARAKAKGFHGLVFDTPQQVYAARARASAPPAQASAPPARTSAPPARAYAAAPQAKAKPKGFHGLVFDTPPQVYAASAY